MCGCESLTHPTYKVGMKNYPRIYFSATLIVVRYKSREMMRGRKMNGIKVGGDVDALPKCIFVFTTHANAIECINCVARQKTDERNKDERKKQVQ